MKKKVKFNKYYLLPLLVLGVFVVYAISNINLNSTGQVIQETQTTTGVVKTTSYVYAGGLAASYDSDGKEKYYINDHLGGTGVVIDKTGNVVASEEYYAFGEEKASTGDEKFTYTGKELDDTGLYYYGARYYDAGVGRFTQPDPISGGIENPQSLNKYVYVMNNPLKYTDPSGMQARPDATRVSRGGGVLSPLSESHETVLFYSPDFLNSAPTRNPLFVDFKDTNEVNFLTGQINVLQKDTAWTNDRVKFAGRISSIARALGGQILETPEDARFTRFSIEDLGSISRIMEEEASYSKIETVVFLFHGGFGKPEGGPPGYHIIDKKNNLAYSEEYINQVFENIPKESLAKDAKIFIMTCYGSRCADVQSIADSLQVPVYSSKNVVKYQGAFVYSNFEEYKPKK